MLPAYGISAIIEHNSCVLKNNSLLQKWTSPESAVWL